MKVSVKYWRSSLAVVMVVMALIVSTPAVFADNINPGVLAINGQVGGLTYGQWSARWWQYALSVTTFANCRAEPSGQMWFLAGTTNGRSIAVRNCTVPSGKNIMFPLFNVEWSVVEAEAQEMKTGTSCPLPDINGDPIKGEDYAALSACAIAMAQHGTDSNAELEAEVDGVSLNSLTHYRALSPAPLFTFTTVKGNPFGLCPTISPCPLRSRAVADGFWIILKSPLPAGKHEIGFEAQVPFFNFFTSGAHYCLIVLPSNQTCP